MSQVDINKIVLQIQAQVHGLDQLDKFTKKLNRIGVHMDRMGKFHTRNGLFVSPSSVAMEIQRINKADAIAKKVENDRIQALRDAERATRKAQMAMLSFGFTALFTGMAIQRLGTQIMNSLVKTYMQATDENSRLNQSLMGIQAAFEFLKFSIMDALNTEFVIGFIEGIINVVNWISEWVNKNPDIAAMVVTFSVMAVVLGGIAMVIGQIALATVGLGIGFIPLVAIILVASALAALLVSIFVTDMKKANPVLTALKVTLAFIAVVLLTALSPLIGIIAYFVLLGVIIAKLGIDFGSFGNFFKAVLRGIIMVVGLVGQAIVSAIITPLQWVAVALIRLIDLMNSLTGTKIGTKSLEDFVNWKPDIAGMAAELATSIKFDETKGALFKGSQQGNVTNITVNGDVTDAHLMDTVKKGIDQHMSEISNRYNGTTTGG